MMQETVTIATPDQVTLEFDLAGLGSRFAAYVFDLQCIALLLLTIVLGVVASIGLGAVSLSTGQDHAANSWLIAMLVVLFFLVMWGYFVVCEWWMHGQTPGKKALGLRVIRADGSPIAWREAALRNLARIADMLPPPSYLLGGVVMHCDQHGRRLGDMLAGTLVVRDREITSLETATHIGWGARWLTRLERGQSGHVTLPQGSISAEQLGLIDQFLQRQHTLSPDRREALGWQILTPLLPLLGATPPQTSGETYVVYLRHILALAEHVPTLAAGRLDATAIATEKQRHWQQFHTQVQHLLRGGRRALRRLSPTALHTFMTDYRRISADLSRARSLGADSHTLVTLNRLGVLGHNVLYGYPPPTVGREPRAWFSAFPRAVRAHSWAVWLAAGLFFVPACISYVAVQQQPEYAYDLVAEDFIEFTPTDKAHLHRIPHLFRPIAASAIITNNIQVTLLAFGLGLTAGLGTCGVLLSNGVHLGAVAGWLALQGYSAALWGWIMPHGGTEILAIILSGAAGLLLARAIIAPGAVKRTTALKRVAPQALVIELGCMVMLIIAGVIEGFVSPSELAYPARLAVLVVSLCGWGIYLIRTGVRRHV